MGHVWLVGMMGSGKTTVGRLTAERLGVPFYDTDGEVEEATGLGVAALFAERGEEAFRSSEHEAVFSVADRPSGIVATGGGAVLDHRNVARMRETGTVVLLDAPVDVLFRRVGDAASRPLLAGASSPALHRIALDRAERYRAAADVVVDAAGDLDTVAARLESLWNES